MAEGDFELDVSEYLKEIESLFHGLPDEVYKIERNALAAGMRQIRKEVIRTYPQYFPNAPAKHDKTHFTSKRARSYKVSSKEPMNLFEGIKTRTFKKPSLGTIIYSNVHAPTNAVLYGFALAKGFSHRVRTKKGYKTITVESKDWIQEPAEAMAKSSLVRNTMDRTVKRAMAKMMKDPKNYKFKETQ